MAKKGRPFSQGEIEELREIYAEAQRTRSVPRLQEFCKKHGRWRTHVSRKARQVGLQFRPKQGTGGYFTVEKEREAAERRRQRDRDAAIRRRQRDAERRWKQSQPGRAAATEQQARAARKASAKAKEAWLSRSDEEREEIKARRRRTMLSRYGQGAANGPGQAHTRGVGGIRQDLGIYMRSTWEANWARYLNLLKKEGRIRWWRYEPRVFLFADNDPVLSYRPDFIVKMSDGSREYHEIKGYMTDRSKATLNCMQNRYPYLKLRVIRRKQYREMQKRYRDRIPEWEDCPAAARKKIQRRRRRAGRPTESVCEWCGDRFVVAPTGPLPAFCGNSCRIQRKRKSKKVLGKG